MSLVFKNKGQSNIGIDIGSSLIKAVVLDMSANSAALVKNIVIQQRTADLAADIKKITAKLNAQPASTRTSVAGPATIMRVAEMPNMSDKELKSAVKFEVEKYIPYKTNEVITDCFKIESAADGKIKVLIAAAKKELINERVGVFKNANTQLDSIDVDALCVLRAFANANKEKMVDESFILVNSGACFTNINICKGSQSYVVRDVQLAGNEVTGAIADKMGIDLAQAEKIKLSPNDKESEIIPIIRNIFFNLLNEIRLSIDYYENHYASTVKTMYICGGTSNLRCIDEIIKEIFSGEIKRFNPLNGLEIDSALKPENFEQYKAMLPVAIGLALREV